MVMAAKGQETMPVRGYLVSRAEVRHLLDRLRKIPVKERANVQGLSPDRADIIVAGLAIVDRIVRAHGGTVQIDSSAAEGSTITLVLPQRAITPSQPPMEAT